MADSSARRPSRRERDVVGLRFAAYRPSGDGGRATKLVGAPPPAVQPGGRARRCVLRPPPVVQPGGSVTKFVAEPPPTDHPGGTATKFVAEPPPRLHPGGTAMNCVCGAPWTDHPGGTATKFVADPPPRLHPGGTATQFVCGAPSTLQSPCRYLFGIRTVPLSDVDVDAEGVEGRGHRPIAGDRLGHVPAPEQSPPQLAKVPNRPQHWPSASHWCRCNRFRYSLPRN